MLRAPTPAIFAVLAMAVGGCGAGDTGKPAVPDHRQLGDPDVPFTFAYPLNFREATERTAAQAGALVAVGPAAKSYLAVRLNGMRELSLAALERQARLAIGASIRSSARESHSGIPMVAVTLSGPAPGIRSTIYGFSLAGRSWLLECQSARPDHRAIASACRTALGTIAPVKDASSTAPNVAVRPERVAPGQLVTYTGTGWPPNARVELLAGPPRSEASPFAHARTDARGAFQTSMPVPQSASAGTIVVLVCRRECRVKASTRLTIGS